MPAGRRQNNTDLRWTKTHDKSYFGYEAALTPRWRRENCIVCATMSEILEEYDFYHEMYVTVQH